MQELNNDMDELFRLAAEEYPLGQNKNDWKKILPQLTNTTAVAVTSRRKKGLGSILPILLCSCMFLFTGGALFQHQFTTASKEPELKKELPLPVRQSSQNSSVTAVVVKKNVKIDFSEPADQQLNFAVPAIQQFDKKFGDIMPLRNSLLSVPVVNSTKKINVKHKPGLYLGVIAGGSVNQVKGQGQQQSGYDIGLTIGMRLTKNLSIESGIIYEKKKYFSEGKYFNMKKASATMPAGMTINSLNGSSSIFEIPVNVKLDIATKPGSHLFAKTGVSTFLLTGEYNKYQAVLNGSAQNIKGAYRNTTNYFAAALNASIGFEKKIGKSSAQISIAPYIQIPLRGIGIGQLPVTTTGIHIGLTGAVFKRK
jgi:hypothetical protein